MQVYKIDPLHDPRWAEFVQSCPNASIFHTRAWLDSICRTYKYRPVAFTTSPPNGELRNGLVFCHIRSWITGSRMVSVPFSDHCDPLVSSAEEFDFLVNYLRADMEHRDWKYLEIRPVDGRFEGGRQAAGFYPASSFHFHRVNLRPSLGEIFESLDKDSVQRRVQRAERADLSYETGRPEELLREFYGLLVQTRGRHGVPPQPYNWFRNLTDCMGDALQVRVAYKDQLPIAAVLTLRFRKTVYYKYGCSDAKYHKLGAMPALLWKTIEDSKANGSEELDLGRSDYDNKGLVAFKDHWTHNRSRLIYWRYPMTSPLAATEGWKLKLIKGVFAIMPERLRISAGHLMYRHIG